MYNLGVSSEFDSEKNQGDAYQFDEAAAANHAAMASLAQVQK